MAINISPDIHIFIISWKGQHENATLQLYQQKKKMIKLQKGMPSYIGVSRDF